jgi:hypothetical protein
MLRPAACALVITALGWAPAAHGATIEHTADIGPQNDDFISYTAARGERNRLVVTDSSQGLVFRDPGARIHGTFDFGGCKVSRDGHRAVCHVDRYLPLSISLSDRNDSLRFHGQNNGAHGPKPRTAVDNPLRLRDKYEDLEGGSYEDAVVYGGNGCDVLSGTDGFDYIDPGPGADHVDASGGHDWITDRPDHAHDVLLGGNGIDTLEAAGTRGVRIALGPQRLHAGAEVDRFDSIESGRGGAGDDTVIGTAAVDGVFGGTGSDRLMGRGGDDYLGGDLPGGQYYQRGSPGHDTIDGGPGDDVLDARDDEAGALFTPTDTLICGEGRDRTVARQDDVVDSSCESSTYGVFSGDVTSQYIDDAQLSALTPVARGEDGAPTYRIKCPAPDDCVGRLQLQRPPTGPKKSGAALGSARFHIRGGTRGDVAVVLNDAGRAWLSQPGARASVRVTAGYAAGKSGRGESADFGWQQVLGPP